MTDQILVIFTTTSLFFSIFLSFLFVFFTKYFRHTVGFEKRRNSQQRYLSLGQVETWATLKVLKILTPAWQISGCQTEEQPQFVFTIFTQFVSLQYKAKQPLRGMTLWEKEEKDKKDIEELLRKSTKKVGVFFTNSRCLDYEKRKYSKESILQAKNSRI